MNTGPGAARPGSGNIFAYGGRYAAMASSDLNGAARSAACSIRCVTISSGSVADPSPQSSLDRKWRGRWRTSWRTVGTARSYAWGDCPARVSRRIPERDPIGCPLAAENTVRRGVR